MPSRHLIPRRTFLKGMVSGLAVALGLPMLETMGWADSPPGKGGKQPVRLGYFYVPYGFGRSGQPSFWPAAPNDFSPTGKLSLTLEALRPVVGECLLLGGLTNDRADHGVPAHANELAGFLTCAPCSMENEKKATCNIGISADQVAALQLGGYTTLPSLELGVSDCNLSGTTEGGYSAAYNHTMSYRSATQALPSENNPRSVLNRLFSTRRSMPARRGGGPAADTSKFAATPGAGGADEQSADQSMLDLVLGSADHLRGRVSRADQRTLDEYLDGVRSLEKRVVAIEKQQAEAANAAANKATRKGKFSDPITVKPCADGAPFSEHLQCMIDLMILAFQTDTTRVCTLPFSTPYDGRNYPELGFTDDHHAATHQQDSPDKHYKIDALNVKMFASMVQKMRALADGTGSLLDNSILLFGSGMADWSHDIYNHTPVILAGRGGGTINPGRFIQAQGNMGDLHTALLARAGCTLDKPFGNGTKRLPDLS